MTKIYHISQQWHRFLKTPLGARVLDAEKEVIRSVCEECSRQQVLLMGVPAQQILLQDRPIFKNRVLMAPWGRQGIQYDARIDWIESDFTHPLPILAGSLDTVILPHTLEWVEDCHAFLSAICALLKPEGELIVLGFNPFGTWSVRKRWPGSPISSSVIQRWLNEEDFDLMKKDMVLFCPPFMKKRAWLEWIGRYCCRPVGGVYCLRAKRRVIPVTPISFRWPLESIPLSGVPSMSRNSE